VGVQQDNELGAADLRVLVDKYKEAGGLVSQSN